MNNLTPKPKPIGKLFSEQELPHSTTGRSNEANEWYTPAPFVNAARTVMGGIDLDPASCELANQIVQASRYYSKEQNGLLHPWIGRLWLNPPYERIQLAGKRTHQGTWITRLVEAYQRGAVTQAILLTTCRTDTSWFHLLWNHPICFADRKIGFYSPSKQKVLQERSHIHGTIFVYLGANTRAFIDEFTRFGPVITPDGVHKKVQTTIHSMKLFTNETSHFDIEEAHV